MLKIHDFVGYVETPQRSGKALWHVVQVNAGRERSTAECLEKHGYETYVAMIRTVRLVKRRDMSRAQRAQDIKVMRPAIVALLPGYLFVRFDPEDARWHELFEIKGVRGLVMNDDLPRVFPDKEIAQLKRGEVNGALPGTMQLAQIPFLVGENVRVAAGPFAGFPAIVEELPDPVKANKATLTLDDLDESMRVKLAVSIFGRDTPVELPVTDIEKI